MSELNHTNLLNTSKFYQHRKQNSFSPHAGFIYLQPAELIHDVFTNFNQIYNKFVCDFLS